MLFSGRYSFVRNVERWGKARNASTHLRTLAPQYDFVAIVDADDQLAEADIIETLAQEYAAGHDVVWTNYVTDDDRVGMNGPLDPTRSPREQGWHSSHLFVCVPQTHLAGRFRLRYVGPTRPRSGRRVDGLGRRVPVVRQQRGQVTVLQRGQPLEDVFQVGPTGRAR
ncbi:MAG: hypothetical protein U1E95_12505 [Rubrivivax sp.]